MLRVKTLTGWLALVAVHTCLFASIATGAVYSPDSAYSITKSTSTTTFVSSINSFDQQLSKYDKENTGAELWYPSGFWDGPLEGDIGIEMLRLIFGSALDNVYSFFSNSDATLDSGLATRTLAVAYGQLMNTIGVLIIFVSLGFSLLSFFAKRAIDVSYLSPEREDGSSFIAMRGSIATIISYPMPFLGGMSPLQGFTIFVLILGLGISTSVIRMSVPFFLAPNAIQFNHPNIDKVISGVLEARLCSDTLDELSGTSGDRLQFREYSDSTGLQHREAIFGQDLQSGGSCGKINIGSYRPITNSTDVDYNTYSLSIVNKAISDSGQLFISSLWFDSDIAAIVELLKSESTSNDENVLVGYYSRLNNLRKSTQSAWLNEITVRVKNELQTETDSNGSTSEGKYVEKIAQVGFFGLGGFYTSLSQRQSDMSQLVAAAYTGVEPPPWKSDAINSPFNKFWNWLWSSDEPSDNEKIIVARKEQFKSFYTAASQIMTDKNPEVVFEAATDMLVKGDTGGYAGAIREYIVKLILNIFEQTENGATFPNPLLTLRRIGNTFQDLVVIIFTASHTVVGEAVSSVVSAKTGGLGGSISSFVLSLIITGAAGFGFFCANILPNIPYIMWTLATFSFLSHSVIAIIGAGWWGAGMTFGEERSLGGRSHEGSNILLTLVIKPMLMTMSFFLAIILNSVFGYFVLATVHSACTSAYYGGFNIFSLIGSLVVAVLLLFIGTMKNLSLIWEMSEMCQRFLGFRGTIDDRSHTDSSAQMQQMSGTLSGNIKNAIPQKPAHG
jgi:conjugal transfer/type IV secretion protein DotA/TraY